MMDRRKMLLHAAVGAGSVILVDGLTSGVLFAGGPPDPMPSSKKKKPPSSAVAKEKARLKKCRELVRKLDSAIRDRDRRERALAQLKDKLLHAKAAQHTAEQEFKRDKILLGWAKDELKVDRRQAAKGRFETPAEGRRAVKAAEAKLRKANTNFGRALTKSAKADEKVDRLKEKIRDTRQALTDAKKAERRFRNEMKRCKCTR